MRMKTISIVKKAFIAVWMFIMFMSCGGGEVTPEKPQSPSQPTETITISFGENLSFDSDGGVSTVSFTATEAWTANVTNNRADTWCTVEPTNGTKGS